MKSLRLFFLTGFVVVACSLQAAVVDTLAVYSNAMKKNVQVVVVSPQNTQSSKKPVIYLLNGYSGDAKSWISMKPELKEIADREDLMFVCPDGNNSWYWDSPKDPSFRYETFVSNELIQYIDAKYPTVKDRKARAITGLSMGGHGAMWLAFRHKDVFGAAGSTSGGLDIRPFPNNWEMSKLLGAENENQEIWDKHTAINQIDRVKNGELALIIDCGYSDFFFEVNNDFHEKLLKYKIDHDFLVRPGGHDGNYWRNSIDYQILFFKNFFNKK
ncbi:alpha/beta hydrolase family protein [Parabacteroides sp. AM08-6]|uniref:alpha/beta hydrolase n=1 Tax=Parabacteroides sp. AM08-6 TaxID=2292053 RepID=UPI000EFE5D75|nr:alpha/beta hydrolase family protein [Parabacteroides sp. AM08-6]RHJ87901.1 esterase family protein [Parabacteroides sp. AM08-6]